MKLTKKGKITVFTLVSVVTIITIVSLLAIMQANIIGAVPGSGKSGNPPGVQPATELQNLVNCCQSQATIAEYQDYSNINAVMGTCMTNGLNIYLSGGLSALQGYINNVCGGACESNLDCDDGNSCTDDLCTPRGCIHGIPIEPRPCEINGQLGMCIGDYCQLPECVEVSEEEVQYGACANISWIEEVNLPQCCAENAPGGINCGADEEWVVGIAAIPTCYIPNS